MSFREFYKRNEARILIGGNIALLGTIAGILVAYNVKQSHIIRQLDELYERDRAVIEELNTTYTGRVGSVSELEGN